MSKQVIKKGTFRHNIDDVMKCSKDYWSWHKKKSRKIRRALNRQKLINVLNGRSDDESLSKFKDCPLW